jgi:thioredoxin reductase (NADPH)
VRKERLLELWQKVLRKTELKIHEGVRVTEITPTNWGFDVVTSAGPAKTKTMLLATGRRGSPKSLGIPGEHLSKVVYSLDEPSQYRGQHVVVVGGGDSALEAAIEVSRHPVASVTLSYRGTVFDRAKSINRQKCDAAVKAGRLQVILDSAVTAIEPEQVVLAIAGRAHALPNDAVIICAGGLLPTSLLADIGVRVERKFGTA